MFLPESVKIVLGVAVLVIAALGYAARRYPHVAWLQPFDLQRHLTPEQRARARQSANVGAAIHIMLLGVIIPIGYFALKVMFLTSPTTGELVAVGAASALCFVIGIVGVIHNR